MATTLNDDVKFVEESNEEPAISKVSHAQTYSAFETSLTWIEAQGDTDPAHLLLVQKWRNYAAMKHTQTLKQIKSVSYYFTTPSHRCQPVTIKNRDKLHEKVGFLV